MCIYVCNMFMIAVKMMMICEITWAWLNTCIWSMFVGRLILVMIYSYWIRLCDIKMLESDLDEIKT